MFFFPVVVQNWCDCNKPPACQVLVCKLFHSICSIYAETLQQLLSLPSYHFGSKNHFCHQLWKLWINSSKEALLKSWRLTLHLIWCILLIKILLNSSTTRWLVLMVCVLSIHVQCATYEQFMAQEILLCLRMRKQKLMQVQPWQHYLKPSTRYCLYLPGISVLHLMISTSQ